MIKWGHISCAKVVYGLEASARCYFVPEPVGSQKCATIPAVPFVWPPRSACLGAAQSLWDGAVPGSPWARSSDAAAELWPWAITASLSLLCLHTCTVLGALCALPVAVGSWPLNNCHFLFTSGEVLSCCLSFSCQHMTFPFHWLVQMSVTCVNLGILLFPFKLDQIYYKM